MLKHFLSSSKPVVLDPPPKARRQSQLTLSMITDPVSTVSVAHTPSSNQVVPLPPIVHTPSHDQRKEGEREQDKGKDKERDQEPYAPPKQESSPVNSNAIVLDMKDHYIKCPWPLASIQALRIREGLPLTECFESAYQLATEKGRESLHNRIWGHALSDATFGFIDTDGKACIGCDTKDPMKTLTKMYALFSTDCPTLRFELEVYSSGALEVVPSDFRLPLSWKDTEGRMIDEPVRIERNFLLILRLKNVPVKRIGISKTMFPHMNLHMLTDPTTSQEVFNAIHIQAPQGKEIKGKK